MNNKQGLEADPCWPKAIAPEDPGYILLTEDKYYNTYNGVVLNYDEPPNQQRIDAAEAYKSENPSLISRGLRRGRPRRGVEEIIVLPDGDLGARDANVSRRLTTEEAARDVEVIKCRDRFCLREKALLKDETALVIPGPPLPNVPAVNLDAVPTDAPSK